MANSPIRVSVPPHESIQPAFIPPHERIKAGAFDVDTIFASLREALSSGTQELGPFAASIADAAQFLTEATGAAVGMRYGDGVFCLGRSGPSAPPLGAELTLKSGFSAECVRTGKSLRCDDARHDYRTDASVCRRLGVFSIAAVPIRGVNGCIGLLEAFSNQTYAFSEKHMVFLERLAELASIAQERELEKQSLFRGEEHQTRNLIPTVRIVPPRVRTYLELARPRNWALGAAVLALLISVVRLEPWRTTTTARTKSHVIEQQPIEPERVVIDAILPSVIAAAPTTSPLESSEASRREIPQGLSGGTLLRKVHPVYPRDALASHLQGSVTLFGTVGESGQLQGLRIMSGDPVLARAALDAVQQWQYEPYMMNGKPIPRTIQITVQFKLPTE